MSEATSQVTAQVYEIPAQNWVLLLTKFGEIIKKAEKLGVPAPKLTLLGERVVERKNRNTGIKYEHRYLQVAVEGESPMIAGWSLVSVIEKLEDGVNVIRNVPGRECPAHYRSCASQCDHCGTDRRRKETFVLVKREEDGTPYFKQVGRNCLADFLGGVSPEALVRHYELTLDSIEELQRAGEDSYGWGSSGPRGWNIQELVATASIVTRRFGWLSRSKAREFNREGQATADLVLQILCCRLDDEQTKRWIRENELVVEPKDIEDAKNAIEWAKTLGTGEDVSDYEYNLGALSRFEFVEYKNVGIIVSLIAAYKRHCDRVDELRRIKETKENKFLGEIGKRQVFENVTVKSTKYFEGDYGVRTQVRFETPEGSTLIWWASGEPEWVKENETYNIKATVKKHDTWKDWNQTIVNRVAKI